jgi:hypothetical protein
MADKRISQLIERTDIANNDVLPIVASGATTTNKVTISTIQDWMQDNLDVGVTSVGITLGTTGTDVNVTGSPITSSGNITINIPTASATNRGLLSSADWTTFNSKQPAGNYVTLDTAQTITAQKTFTTSGSSDTMIISHGSGSGFALDVIKAGNGEAIRVQKTSGSGNAMTISGGNFEAGTIVKTGGTSSQFLKADGSVDSSNYLTTGTASLTYITIATPTTITGVKTFDTGTLILAAAGTANSTHLRNSSGDGTSVSGSNVFGFNSSNNIYVRTQSKGGFIFNFNNGAANRTYTLPDATGTISLTSDLGSYVPYTGATGAVDLGTHTLSSNNLIANGGLNAGALLLKNANAASTINTGYLTLSPSSTTTRVTFGFSTGASTWKSLSFSSHLLTDNTPTIFSFPNGGGTLAVTTDLGAYLPLTGGTLTGALNGTSATLSSNFYVSGGTLTNTGNGVHIFNESNFAQVQLNGATGSLIDFSTSGTDSLARIIYFNSAQTLNLINAGTTALSIASTGAATFSSSVGIGITPSYRLHVVTDAVAGKQNMSNISRTTGNWVRFTNPQFSTDASMGLILKSFPDSDGRQGAGIIASGGQNNASTDLDLFVTTSPDGSGGTSYSALKINGFNGNVGIGTASPDFQLHLFKPSGSVSLALQSSNNYGYLFNDGTNIGLASNIGSTGLKLLVNRNAPDNSLVVNSTGNVGIGTAVGVAPTARLSLGAASQGNRITFEDYSNIFSEYSSGDFWLSSNFYGNLDSSGYVTSTTASFGAAGIAVSGTGASLNGVIKFFVDSAASKTAGASFTPTEQMRITSDGYARLSASSGGIQFNGDTAAANALDDYEEGTWTGTLTPVTSGTITVASVTQPFGYTKIGRQVTITGLAVVQSVSSPVGLRVRLGNLPFTVANSVAARAGGSVVFFDASASYAFTAVNGYVEPNLSYVNINFDTSTLAANDEFAFTFTYIV